MKNNEIKFKAKIINTGEIIQITALDLLHQTWIGHKDRYGDFDEIQLLQYTGIKDKYDNDIYEGDKIAYPKEMVNTLKSLECLDIKEGMVEDLIVENNTVKGVILKNGEKIPFNDLKVATEYINNLS